MTDIDFTPWPRIWTALICMAAVFATHYLWHPEWQALSATRPDFYIVSWALTIIAFVVFVYCIVKIADPNKDWTMWAAVIVAVAALAWNMGWLSQYRSDKEQGLGVNNYKTKTICHVSHTGNDSSVFLLRQP